MEPPHIITSVLEKVLISPGPTRSSSRLLRCISISAVLARAVALPSWNIREAPEGSHGC